MTGTVTYVGLDVHARSMDAAAIDVLTGELSRVRFGPRVEEPVAWLAGCALRCGLAMRPGRPGSGSIARPSRRGWGGGDRAGQDTPGPVGPGED